MRRLLRARPRNCLRTTRARVQWTMALFTLASVNVDACLLAHAVSLFIGLVVSAYYLVGAITHNIPKTLTKGRVCTTLCFVFAILVRYFQFMENVLWYALGRGLEMALLLAAVIYTCEHVAENIFIALSLPFPTFVKHMLTALRVLIGLGAVAPSIELAVTLTSRALHVQIIVGLVFQLTASILVCSAFAYFTYLVLKFRRWRLESGMDHLHAYATALSRKKYETALTTAVGGVYSAALVWTIVSVIESSRGNLDGQANISMLCPPDSYVTIWVPIFIVICLQLITHDRTAERRRSEKARDEYARTQTIARVLPSPRCRARRSSIQMASEEI